MNDERRGSPAAPDPPPLPTAPSSLLASTSVIAIATLLSRVTGFAKQVVLLAALGTTVASSYTLSTQIPNMISELLVGAVLTAIVVPVIVRAEREDSDRGELFVRRIVTLAATMLVLAAVVFTVSTPVLVRTVFLPNDSEVSAALTTALTYLVVPAVVFYGISALLTAVLNTREVFVPGAWAPVLNNVTVLSVFAIYTLMPGDLDPATASVGTGKVFVLGLGTAIGVVVQAMVLLPAVRAHKINLRPAWGFDRRLATFGGMAAAVVVYVLISQLGLIISNRVAAGSDAAGPAIYASAWLLLQLPYGILGVTVLTVLMPRLSRHSAAGETGAVIDDLALATRTTLVGMIPAAAFFTAFGPIVVEVAFSYGKFAGGASALAHAVSWSAFTLVPYALVLVHLRYFYANQRSWTPTWIILGITTVKVTLSAFVPMIATTPQDVAPLLGAVNGLSFGVGALIGWVLIRRNLGPLILHRVRRDTTWLLISAAGGTTAAAAVLWGVRTVVTAQAKWAVAFELIVVFLVFVAATGTVAYLGRVTEVRSIVRVLHPKLTRILHRTSAAPSTPHGEAVHRNPIVDDASMGPVAHPTTVIANVHVSRGPRHPSSRENPAPRTAPGAVVGDGQYRLTSHVSSSGVFDYWDGLDRSNSHPVSVVLIDHDGRDSTVEWTIDRARRVESFRLPGVDALVDVLRTQHRTALVFRPELPSVQARSRPARTLDSVRALAHSALLADAAGSSLNLATVEQVRFDHDGIAHAAFPVSTPGDVLSDLHTIGLATSRHLHANPPRSRNGLSPATRTADSIERLTEHLLSADRTSNPQELWELVSHSR